MKPKIIHIFHDDKFIDPAIKLFEEVCPDQSEYYVIKKESESFQYVKTISVKRLDYTNVEHMKVFIDKINSNSNQILFFHALNAQKQQIALNCNSNIVKVWFIWGYDFYHNWGLLKNNIYESQTKKVIEKKVSLKNRLIFNRFSFFLFYYGDIINRILPYKIIKVLDSNYNTQFYKATLQMDVIVPVVPTEFDLIQKMRIKGKYAPFTYGCIEDLLGDKINENIQGQPNILVGNSADPSNNHIDIFLKLSKLNLKDRKVYVPLSYSGNEQYKRKVIEYGYQLFGDKFQPLTNFMLPADYNNILLTCGTLIFNHIRQQGVGNIIIMGYLGAKIYLNKKSPVYKFYKGEGIVIYKVDELNEKLLDRPFTLDVINNNRNILFELYSRKKVYLKIKKLINIVENIKK